MPKRDPLEAAYWRCALMITLLGAMRDDALRDPMRNHWKDLGLVEVGDTKADATARITAAFDEMLSVLNHLRIVDLTASFELAANQRMANRIGEARKVLAGVAKKGALPAFHERLVVGGDDFTRLTDYIQLLEGHLSEEVIAALKVARASRNAYAHGTDIHIPPQANAEETLSNLSAARDLL